jgi:membrane fusion protein, multidrug efflux system
MIVVPGVTGSRGRRGGCTGLMLAGVTLALACSPKTPQQKPGGAPGGPVPVTVATAERRDVPVTLAAMGAVQASNTVNVRARVGGELTQVAFTEGQNVRPGDLLFTIDSRPYEAALQSAQADSARDAARLASAQSQEQRYAELIGKDYVTKQDNDDVKANAAALRATLQADAAAVRNARLNLGYCTVRAPISGRTGVIFARRGSLVSASDPTPLVVIQQLVPVQVSFAVPEQRLPEIRRYAGEGTLQVRVTAEDDSTKTREGTLAFIDNAVDRSTGTILLKATFPNEDEALWPGQFVDVSLVLTTTKNAVVIPAQAVQASQRGDFVYLVKPDLTVGMQPVTVAMGMSDQVVVSQGVQPGDRVVTDGQLRLFPGAKAEIKQAGGGPPAGVPAGSSSGGATGR